jgi:hypothetical protein
VQAQVYFEDSTPRGAPLAPTGAAPRAAAPIGGPVAGGAVVDDVTPRGAPLAPGAPKPKAAAPPKGAAPPQGAGPPMGEPAAAPKGGPADCSCPLGPDSGGYYGRGAELINSGCSCKNA